MAFRGYDIPKSRKALYVSLINTTRWRKIRLQKLGQQPLCEMCLKAGRTTLAKEVHHIAPIEQAPTKSEATARAYDIGNLMSLCVNCHKEIHLLDKKEEPRNPFLESLHIDD